MNDHTSPLAGLQGGLMVCGTASDSGKSFVVAGLCRLLARHGVRVAPFKAQNMANNAAVTADGAEIGHAQWAQALAAGAEPTSDMNPVLLKPTSERRSQVVVHGRPLGVMDAATYHEAKAALRPVVLEALARLRTTYDVVICEGAGSPAEINLLDRDIVNLAVARDAGLPALVVGDIDRGGVFASLYGTVALLPDDLRPLVKGFVVNKLRGDPALLGSVGADLEARCGVPTLGVVPMVDGPDLEAEDSLTLDNQVTAVGNQVTAVGGTGPESDGHLDVAVIRWPTVANANDLDPLRVEPGVRLRWVRSAAELGRPDLVVLPGSKATRADLDWFRGTGLAGAVGRDDAAVVAICAGVQMCGTRIEDTEVVEGPPGSVDGLGWLPVTTSFAGDKVLDRPTGTVVDGPAAGELVAGYRIHHGRVRGPSGDSVWLRSKDGEPLGWHREHILGTTLHSLFEDDGFRAALLAWAAGRSGRTAPAAGPDFATVRRARFDTIATSLEAHLDLPALAAVIRSASRSSTAPDELSR
jgi:adenosylcobyric acid synthase